MRLFIRSDITTCLNDVPESLTVSQLRSKVRDVTGYPTSSQYLRLSDHSLCSKSSTDDTNDDPLLCDLGVEHESTIFVSLRILGGIKNPSNIKNKAKRQKIYKEYKELKKKEKKETKIEKLKEVEALGDAAPAKQIPRTLDNSRIVNDNVMEKTDDELLGDEKDDEFSTYFSNIKKPKIMITTRPKPSRKLFPFIADLMQMIPQAYYYPREKFTITELQKKANERNFTHLICLSEKNKTCNGLLFCHLPEGPTAYFKLSSFQAGSTIKGHGKPTSHIPEIIMNNFTTRLGKRASRILGSLFPHEPQFEGRQVVTFHNQRDFIFVRHHRYIYRTDHDKTRARLQELGPRFTLKLKWLQEGTLDREYGEYEWIHKRGEQETNRRKFEL